MNLGVVGSRGFNNYQVLEESLEVLLQMYPIKKIVSGGAKGADSLAEVFAASHGLGLILHFPDVNTYYPFVKAARERNILIVKDSDIVVAFWDGRSTGTKHTINVCKAFKKECIVIPYD